MTTLSDNHDYSKTSIGILGLGAIGCLISSQLPRAYNSFALLRNETKQIDFSVFHQHESKNYNLPAWQGELLDVLIICCKATQTLAALSQWRSAIGPDTQIVILQNGFGQHEQVHNLFPQNTIFAASTTEGANKKSRFEINHAGIGITQWGYFAGPKAKLKLNLKQLDGTHQANTQIKQILLDKLAINSVINPLTVKYNCSNGELLTNKIAFTELKQLCMEIESVFHKMDWPLSFNLLERSQQVAQQTSKNISSMLQDVRNSQKTEIDYINGYLINKATENNIKSPLNKSLVEYIKNIM